MVLLVRNIIFLSFFIGTASNATVNSEDSDNPANSPEYAHMMESIALLRDSTKDNAINVYLEVAARVQSFRDLLRNTKSSQARLKPAETLRGLERVKSGAVALLARSEKAFKMLTATIAEQLSMGRFPNSFIRDTHGRVASRYLSYFVSLIEDPDTRVEMTAFSIQTVLSHGKKEFIPTVFTAVERVLRSIEYLTFPSLQSIFSSPPITNNYATVWESNILSLVNYDIVRFWKLLSEVFFYSHQNFYLLDGDFDSPDYKKLRTLFILVSKLTGKIRNNEDLLNNNDLYGDLDWITHTTQKIANEIMKELLAAEAFGASRYLEHNVIQTHMMYAESGDFEGEDNTFSDNKKNGCRSLFGIN